MKNTVLIALICLPFGLFAQVVDSAIYKQVDSLISVSYELSGKREYEKALEINAVAEELSLANYGRESVAYGNACFNHGLVLHEKGNYQEAEKWYLEANKIRAKTHGKEHKDYALSLDNLADVYLQMRDFSKSEQAYLELKAIREKTLGINHADYISTIGNIGLLYSEMGDFEQAILTLIEAATLREKAFGKENKDYATNINNLGLTYLKAGNYEKAEPLLLEGMHIREKVVGKSHPQFASSLNNLAHIYANMGDYEKAEPFLVQSKDIRAETLGKTHPRYGWSVNNLASLYGEMGNYEKAEALFIEAVGIKEKTLGNANPDYALSLNNLAKLYQLVGKFEKVEKLILEAMSIQEKRLGEEHLDYLSSLDNLANLYQKMGMLDSAKHVFFKEKNILERTLQTEHPDYARCLHNLAATYYQMGHYAEAETLYLESITIYEKSQGKMAPNQVEMLNNLADARWSLQKYEAAGVNLSEATTIEKELIVKASRHLSERELSSFIHKFEASQNRDLSFLQLHANGIATCYDNTLFHKGFLLNALSQVNKLATTNPATTEQYYQLKSYRRRLAVEYAKPIAERKTTAELEEKANTLEKDLTRNVAGFGEALRQVTWQEVQQNLRPGEAAIEFVHYKFINPKPTDSTMYAALVLFPGTAQPTFIPLFEEKQLDALLQSQGKSKPDFVDGLYSVGDGENSLYNLLWQPLEQAISEAQTVYFSPSGLLHRLNLGAIAMPPMFRGEAPGETLADRYRLIELGSTRQLVVPSSTKSTGNDAMLYGGLSYEMDSTAIASSISSLGNELLATRRGLDFANADSTLRGGKWGYLRWTDVEVSSTEEIFAEADLRPTVRKGYEGTEESFKAIGTNGPSPRVLHLATHGFFFPDPKTTGGGQQAVDGGEPVFKISDHPMIRAGLVFAGGNYAWQTGKPFRPDREDGILTAYEISQMSLSNTELVVLSACETGLGDIQGNEGVYGLQRAFKIAGAKYLIMSLWQVPDFQTQELMTSFYSLWLEDKMTIPDAFRAAQKKMKEKYKSPFLWAGFVLVE